MTVREAISLVDDLKPNQYSDEIKLRWLSMLEHSIYTEIINTHIANDNENFGTYTEFTESDYGKTLVIPFPYDEVYTAFLKMKIDDENQETARYNNSVVIYNSLYDNFEKAFNKTHMPIKRNKYNIWR